MAKDPLTGLMAFEGGAAIVKPLVAGASTLMNGLRRIPVRAGATQGLEAAAEFARHPMQSAGRVAGKVLDSAADMIRPPVKLPTVPPAPKATLPELPPTPRMGGTPETFYGAEDVRVPSEADMIRQSRAQQPAGVEPAMPPSRPPTPPVSEAESIRRARQQLDGSGAQIEPPMPAPRPVAPPVSEAEAIRQARQRLDSAGTVVEPPLQPARPAAAPMSEAERIRQARLALDKSGAQIEPPMPPPRTVDPTATPMTTKQAAVAESASRPPKPAAPPVVPMDPEIASSIERQALKQQQIRLEGPDALLADQDSLLTSVAGARKIVDTLDAAPVSAPGHPGWSKYEQTYNAADDIITRTDRGLPLSETTPLWSPLESQALGMKAKVGDVVPPTRTSGAGGAGSEMSATPGLTVNDMMAIGMNPKVTIKTLTPEAAKTILDARKARGATYSEEWYLKKRLDALMESDK